MLNNFRNLISLYRSLGGHWLAFRIGYALRMRTGLIRKQIPAYRWQDRPLATWLKETIPSAPSDYAAWRRQHSPKLFSVTVLPAKSAQGERSDEDSSRRAVEGRLPGDIPWDPQLAVDEAERILNGELKYFAHKFVKTGFPPDWHTDPVSGKQVDPNRHWSGISNEGDLDIKFIWEASRFSMVYTLVRAYGSTRDERFAEVFWELIQSWAESNPPNTGPNWMDGQEAALRVMAWTFGFYAFLESPSTPAERIAQFTAMIAAHAERIYKNIDYAIFTRSNHTISEAFGLWLVGILFPELQSAETYVALGRKLLEREATAQIFPDGSYSMHSLNYHRFILHIYFCAIRLGELNGSPFSETLQGRVTKSVDYLYALMDAATGQMPLYGSNDGALVLPLNNCDFTDYRPLLQLGSYLMKQELLFDPGPWDEDIYWLCGVPENSRAAQSPQGERSGSEVEAGVREKIRFSFPHAGAYLLRGANSKAVIRCADFRSRPSHADQLQVDLWLRGINIACDAGTYLYNAPDRKWQNGLAHTSVHNTVTVDAQDQMTRVSRFIWTNWSKGKVLRHDEKIWQGEHNGYKRLTDPVKHRRTALSLGEDRWLVVDHLDGRQPHHYALHWLLDDLPYEQQGNSILLSLDSITYNVQVGLVEGQSACSVVRADLNSRRGWRSRYYGHREPAISVLLEADRSQIIFWSFFGLESDSVELVGNLLKIRFAGGETSVHLQSPASNYQ